MVWLFLMNNLIVGGGMMKINSKKQLPKEFDLKKYEQLDSMSDKDLFRQVYCRMGWRDNWSDELASYYLEFGECLPIDEEDPFNELKNALPDWYYNQFVGGKDFMDRYHEKSKTCLNLSTGYSVGYLSRSQVRYFAGSNDLIGDRVGKPFIIPDDEIDKLMEEDEVNHGLLMAREGDAVSLVLNETLYLSVNLTVTDEIILGDIRKLLPVWREELGVSVEEQPVNSSWGVIRKKIIDYKVLPFIDLMLWARVKKLSIPSGVMAVALFPDGEKDGYAIVQTIKPFVEKLMTFDSLEKLKREISM